jgi:hypothetical protein
MGREAMIEQYTFGSMRIGGRDYRHDLKILRGKVESEWWRKQSHVVDDEEMADILSIRPRVLVIGTGYAGNMRVADSLRQRLSQQGIRLIAEATGEAVRSFNDLVSLGENIAGAFHLTC